jgi:hypothetical protein
MSGWVVCPFLNRWDWTAQALTDALAQTVQPDVLAIAIGVDDDTRQALEAWAEREPRLHPWCWTPGLPSLSATWNRALEFVWSLGGVDALVINNDVRIRPELYETLRCVRETSMALFVSAVGRREPDIAAMTEALWAKVVDDLVRDDHFGKGGPDFSCFLITEEGHGDYPFDEGFQPAYCEDCDAHRRYLLGGDGEHIFSVNFPYLHYGAGTINAEPAQAERWAAKIARSRAHYVRKWGGTVNEERFTIPFDASTAQDHVTNPELQAGHVGTLPDLTAGLDMVLSDEQVKQFAPMLAKVQEMTKLLD